MSFILPPLPFSKDALEPFMSKETIEFHYEKHHRGYVNKLNQLTKDSALAEKSLDELVLHEKGKIFNLAAQTWNHTFFWNSLTPKASSVGPTGKVLALINEFFGSFEKFKAEFNDQAANHFGSGWAWLVYDANKKLSVVTTHDAGSPITEKLVPLLTCDLWEHAYYIDYRNDRPTYINNWWQIINWESVEQRLLSSKL